MIDSTNPRSMADNIRKLWDKFKSISGDLLPSRSTATTGQILKLTGESKAPTWADEYSYIPPAYSTTETATGQKWIDNRDVYRIVFTGLIPTSTDSVSPIIGNIKGEIVGNFIRITTSSASYISRYPLTHASDGSVIILSIPAAFTNSNYVVIIDYVKTPVPSNAKGLEDSEEPEEKKTTKKKTTK